MTQPYLDSDAQHADCPWFLAKAKGRAAHESLTGLTEEMRRKQGSLLENTRKCIAIYQWGAGAENCQDDDDPVLSEEINAYNAAQNVVETTHSKVCKSRILPMPLTEGGGYLQRKQAKEIGKALEGEFDKHEIDQIKEDVVMDALVTAHGAGAIKVYASRTGKLMVQHVPIEDVWFDPAETRYRRPRCLYHVMPIDKFVVLAEYGEDDEDLEGTREVRRAAIIHAASLERGRQNVGGRWSPTQIEVVEAWHLPSNDCDEDEDEESDDATEEAEDGEEPAERTHDGRHVIAIAGCTLVDEPWDGKSFPIEFYVPRKRRRSIWGLSMMFDLVAPQREFEKLTRKVQVAHQKLGVNGWTAPKDARLNAREIVAGTEAAGFVVEYDGQQGPSPLVVEPVSQGTYAYKDSIPRDMMQHKGVSSLSASSQLPAGLQQASGKALQVFEDFESERLLPYHRELERWTMRVAWLIVRTIHGIVQSGKSPTVRYQGKHGSENLKWKEVLPKKLSALVMRVFPVSALSKQPSALFAQLTELLNAEAITVEQFKRLFSLPDLEAENQLDTADTDIIDRNMDIMITTGRYLSPEPFDDLPLLIKRAGKMINLCRTQEVPEPRLKLLSDYIEDAKGLMDQMAEAERAKQAEAAAKAAAAMPPPPPPPVLDMPPMPAAPPMAA
jgi:hypothetical protein